MESRVRFLLLLCCIGLCVARTGIEPRLEHIPSVTGMVEFFGHLWTFVCIGTAAGIWWTCGFSLKDLKVWFDADAQTKWMPADSEGMTRFCALNVAGWLPAIFELVYFFGQKAGVLQVTPWLDRLF